MSILHSFQTSARQHGAPVTVALVVLMAVGFLAGWMDTSGRLLVQTAFTTPTLLSEPWRMLTYPYFTDGRKFIGLVFLCLWLWGIGGAVERELGAKRYLGVWIAFSVLCALGLAIGAWIFNTFAVLSSGWTPVAALTVIWGTRNASAEVRLMFVLPITGRWMAWLAAGLVFFGATPPQVAPFAAAPLFLAYLYAADKIALLPFGYGGGLGGRSSSVSSGSRRMYRKEYYEDVKRREKTRAEKEKLRELFERSMIDDPEDRDGKK